MFGKPTTPEYQRWKALEAKTHERLAAIKSEPVPTVALLARLHNGRIRRLEKHLQEIQEVLTSLGNN